MSGGKRMGERAGGMREGKGGGKWINTREDKSIKWEWRQKAERERE
jgi:hypothetical protein